MLLKHHLSQLWDVFYDQKFISGTEEENSICQSFMANSNDDVDKIKYYWAFYSGCALLINGGEDYWLSTLKPIYEKLYKDLQINVRKTLASSLVEVMKQVDMGNPDNQEFFMKVIQQFTQDIEEIKVKVAP